MMTTRMTEIRARLAELKKIAEMTGLEQTALYGELSVLRRQMDTEMNTLAEGIIAWKAKEAAKEALKAEKKAVKEAIKVARKAEKVAAKEAFEAEKKAAKEALKAEKKAEKLAAKKATKEAAKEALNEDDDEIEIGDITLPDGTNIMVGDDDDVYNEFGEIVGLFCRETKVVTHYDDDEARGVLLSAARSSMRDAFSPWWGSGAKEALKAEKAAKEALKAEKGGAPDTSPVEQYREIGEWTSSNDSEGDEWTSDENEGDIIATKQESTGLTSP